MEDSQNYKHGFVWGDCLVERTKYNSKAEVRILRVYCPNNDLIEIVMRKDSTKINKFVTDIISKGYK